MAATVVVTFDDGPLSADIANPESVADPETLLDPLGRILDTLKRRSVRGVFFVESPDHSQAPDRLRDTYVQGMLAIRQDGHVIGYHCYHHSWNIWVEPMAPAFQLWW